MLIGTKEADRKMAEARERGRRRREDLSAWMGMHGSAITTDEVVLFACRVIDGKLTRMYQPNESGSAAIDLSYTSRELGGRPRRWVCEADLAPRKRTKPK